MYNDNLYSDLITWEVQERMNTIGEPDEFHVDLDDDLAQWKDNYNKGYYPEDDDDANFEYE